MILLITGGTLAAKGRAVKSQLEQLVAEGRGGAPDFPSNRALALLQRVPDGVVLGVIFDMVAKPSLGVALSALTVCVAGSVAIGLLRSSETASESSAERAPSSS